MPASWFKKRTRDNAWEVVPVDASPSEGPLGPVEIQVGRQNSGWTFALHPFSRQMLQELFPDSCRVPSVFIASDNRQNHQTTMGNLAHLSEQVAIILTGVGMDEIRDKFGGYRVYDPVDKKELVSSEPVQA